MGLGENVMKLLSSAFSRAAKIAGEQNGITSRRHQLLAGAGAMFLVVFMLAVIVVIALKVVGWIN